LESTVQHDLVVSGGHLVLGDGVVAADLGVREGRIVTIGVGLQGASQVSARGLLVLPGLVDPHVHPIHAETYRSASEAAIHGGVTTVVHHLYTPPDGQPAPLPFVESAISEAAAESLVDFAFHVRLNALARTQTAIAPLVARGCTSFKLFMAYGGRGIMVGDDEILLALRAAGAAGGLVLVHAENGHLADALEARARAAGGSSVADYYAARPRHVEAEAVRRLLDLVRAVPCPTYLVHLTCSESVAAVAAAKLEGLPIIAETCPHYLLLTADDAAHLGARAKMAPALRNRDDQDALWRALACGVFDTIGSDHSAFVPEEKDLVPNVFDAGFGVPGIATMLPLLYDRGVRAGRLTVERLVAVMATAPARAVGLGQHKGRLAVGADADFVLFDPEANFRIDAGSEHGNGYYSLYEGWQGRGVVQAVYGRGEPLLQDGHVMARPGRGRHLHREGASVRTLAPV
jgi:dihydropyrimidinase